MGMTRLWDDICESVVQDVKEIAKKHNIEIEQVTDILESYYPSKNLTEINTISKTREEQDYDRRNEENC